MIPKMEDLFAELNVTKIVPPKSTWYEWPVVQRLVNQVTEMTEQDRARAEPEISWAIEIWRGAKTVRLHASLLRQRALVAARFDENDLATVTSPDLPPTPSQHSMRYTTNERIAHLELISSRFECDEDFEIFDQDDRLDYTMGWPDAIERAESPEGEDDNGESYFAFVEASAGAIAAWWSILKAANLREDTQCWLGINEAWSQFFVRQMRFKQRRSSPTLLGL
ncbi:hypothetical protein OIO90_002529 [Microbotryomycetes sp. JL221]|nr:hypothetical protein OIO90_002529 [Microbotryomycetes sp. JL221]